MFGYELNLTANWPFFLGVVAITLVLTTLIIKRMLNLKLGPLAITSQQINAQVNNVPVDPTGEYTEPTLRQLVKSTHDMNALHTAMLVDIVKRVTRLESEKSGCPINQQ